MKTFTTLVYASLTTLGVMAACSSDDSGNGGTGTTASTPSTTSTTSPTSTTGSGGTSSTSTTTTTGAGGTGVTTRSCDSLEAQSLDSETSQVPGSIATYSYGDSVSTRCLEAAGANNVCLYGLGADSDDGMGSMYANWGAGLGIQLADAEEDGTVIAPWDAAALGITAVQFTITGATAVAPVRFGMGMVDQTFGDVTIPFTQQPFVNGTDSENDITADGTYTVEFSNLFLPSWTTYTGDCTGNTYCTFNSSQIHSMQFQVVTEPGSTSPYDFCISDITWLDASGAAVDVPVPSTGAGGAGGEAGM